MKVLRVYGKAFYQASLSLLKPMESVQQVNESKGKFLRGWNYLPEEKLDKDLNQRKMNNKNFSMGLLGLKGNHAGEWFGLSRDEPFLIGPTMDATWVVSPLEGGVSQTFLFEPRSRELLSKDAKEFLVNKKKYFRSKLLDYDCIELLGNEFLFLEI